MLKNKIIFKIALYLALAGLLLSDPFISNNFPGLSQGILVFPFLFLSLLDYKQLPDKFFISCVTFYGILVILLFVFSGAKSILLFSTTFGPPLLGVAFLNLRYLKTIFNKTILVFAIFCSFMGLAYYVNLWEIEEFSRRATFMNHNQNYLSHLICIGVSCLAYLFNTTKHNSYKKYILVLIVLLILPVLSTVSRIGVTLLGITLFFNIYFMNDAVKRSFIIIGFVFLLFSGTLVLNLLASKVIYFQQFLDRTSEAAEDTRIELWAIGSNQAKQHWLTGVGFNNFNDEEWRQKVGLASGNYDETSGATVLSSTSIHNSFLDLTLIGGIFLLIPYVTIIMHLMYKSFQLIRLPDKQMKAAGVFILCNTIGIILNSYTGQAASAKYTWYLFAMSYYLIFIYRDKINNQHKIQKTSFVNTPEPTPV